MSEIKHTAGPWRLDYPDAWGEAFVETTRPVSEGRTAVVCRLYDRGSCFPPDDEEREANGRLIAAAPALLAAARAAWQCISELPPTQARGRARDDADHRHRGSDGRAAVKTPGSLPPPRPPGPLRNFDVIPVRLPSGTRAAVHLPRPFTRADAAHLQAVLALYVEEGES